MLSNFEAVENKRRESEKLLQICKTLRVKSGIRRLQAKIKSEISFLERLLKKPGEIKDEHLRSSNLSYLSAVVACVEASQNVEEILKPVSLHSSSGQEYHMTVDVVSDYGKTWIKVVARNPQALLQSSLGAGGFGRRTLIEQVYDLQECSVLCPYLYQPPSIKIWFASGVDLKMKLLLEKMKVTSIGTVVETATDVLNAHDDCFDELVCQMPTSDHVDPNDVSAKRVVGGVLSSRERGQHNFGNNKTVLSLEEIPKSATLNLDVSTLIAHVSALTNGGSHFVFQEEILSEQAKRERDAPVRLHFDALFQGRKLVCCETAHRDFQEILRTVGGTEEKRRAKEFLSTVVIVADQPSSKTMALSISSRVKNRSRIVFGTGDFLQAVTVTANQGFLRAAEAQGFQFVCYLHESRALTEAKESTAQAIGKMK